MNASEVKTLAVTLAKAEHANIAGMRLEVAKLPQAQHEQFVEAYRTAKTAAGASERTSAVRVSEFRLVWRYISSTKPTEMKSYKALLEQARQWQKANDPNSVLDVPGESFKSFDATLKSISEDVDRFGPIARVRFALAVLKGAVIDDKALKTEIDKGTCHLEECVRRASQSSKVTADTRGIKLAA